MNIKKIINKKEQAKFLINLILVSSLMIFFVTHYKFFLFLAIALCFLREINSFLKEITFIFIFKSKTKDEIFAKVNTNETNFKQTINYQLEPHWVKINAIFNSIFTSLFYILGFYWLSAIFIVHFVFKSFIFNPIAIKYSKN